MDISIYVAPKFSGQTSILGVFFCSIQVSLGIEEQTEFHKLQFCPESHGAWNTDILSLAYSDNLPVSPKLKLTINSILSFNYVW